MAVELRTPIRLGLVHDVLAFCAVVPRNVEEICADRHIHRNTFYDYQRLLEQSRLLDELDEPPEGRVRTRARWFSTSPRGLDFMRRYRTTTSLLGSYDPIIEGMDVMEEVPEVPMVEVTCGQCGMPIALLESNDYCQECGFEFPLMPAAEGLTVLFARTLDSHRVKLAEIESFLSSISLELSEERQHSAELQGEVERLYDKLGEMTESLGGVRGLIKSLQPMVKKKASEK